jgi:hypothetical protein
VDFFRLVLSRSLRGVGKPALGPGSHERPLRTSQNACLASVPSRLHAIGTAHFGSRREPCNQVQLCASGLALWTHLASLGLQYGLLRGTLVPTIVFAYPRGYHGPGRFASLGRGISVIGYAGTAHSIWTNVLYMHMAGEAGSVVASLQTMQRLRAESR